MNEFEKLVKQMRQAQKNYFQTRSKHWLTRSKELEKQVDDHLSVKESPTLF